MKISLLLPCFLAPASSSDSSSSLEQEKYLQAILDSIPIYFKTNGNNTLSNRSLIGLSPGTFQTWAECSSTLTCDLSLTFMLI